MQLYRSWVSCYDPVRYDFSKPIQWASNGKIFWEPSEYSHDIRFSGDSQNIVRGSISLRSTMTRFPGSLKSWPLPPAIGEKCACLDLHTPGEEEQTIYCLVIARLVSHFGLYVPPEDKYSLVCLCLVPVHREGNISAKGDTFRRIGICRASVDDFDEKDFKRDQWVTII